MKKFRVAIIGLGKMGFELDTRAGKGYALAYARAIKSHPGLELASGFDINRNKLKSFEKIYRVPGYHYSQLKRRLGGIDVVVVSTPADKHLSVFRDVVSFCRPKLVVMEKPIASELKKAKELISLSKKKKIPLYVNYFRRIDPGIIELKKYIHQGKWGGLKHVNIYYGNGLLNDGSHFVDLVCYVLGKPQAVKAVNLQNKGNPDFLFFYGKIPVFFRSSVDIDYYLKEMDFVFRRARVSYSAFSRTQLMLPKAKPFGIKELIPVADKRMHLDVNRYMSNVARHIYDVLSAKNDLVSSGQTALETLEVCFDVMRKR